MADNYLEKRREAYELKKEAYLRKKKHLPKQRLLPPRPEEEAL